MGPSGRRFRISLVTAVAAVMVISGCSGNSSPSVEKLPTSPGVVKDSIEDLNSTKDMTGVVTKYSSNDNPYLKLIPYVCPFLPDSVTKKLGMTSKNNAFKNQHTLLQACTMSSDRDAQGGKLGITVSVQALGFNEVANGEGRKIIKRNIDLGGEVVGVNYKLDGDDNEVDKVCNLVWGTFYGTAVVTVFSSYGKQIDPCDESIDVAREIQTYLPSKPIEMRAQGGRS